MKPLLSAQAAKANDMHTINILGVSEETLIDRVAQSAFNTLQAGGYDLLAPCILCGSGNNGADGLALACLLKRLGYNASVVYLGKLYSIAAPTAKKKNGTLPDAPVIERDKLGTPDLQIMSEKCLAYYHRAQNQGVEILTDRMPETITVFIDAIYGTGLNGALDKDTCEIIRTVNQSGIPVLSIDIPSGVFANTGETAQQAIRATETMVVQSVKIGLQVYPGAGHAGKLTVVDVGIQSDPLAPDAQCHALEDYDIAMMKPVRPARSTKHTFGRVLVIGGSLGMAGAAYMAAMGAYRAGAGLVEIFTQSKNRMVLQQLIPEAVLACYDEKKDMTKKLKAAIKRADAIVIGCGLGQDKLAKQIVSMVLKQASVPMVVDADALNIIAAKPAMFKKLSSAQKARTVMTPHAAEAARLLGNHMQPETVLHRVYINAQMLYTQYGVNVMLKDAHSVLYTVGGAYFVNLAGNTALATAGSGDVLAGIIGGLISGKSADISVGQMAALGAYLHGKAGEKAAEKMGEHAVMARDILDGLAHF